MLISVFNRAACIMTSCDKWNKSYSASSTASQQNCGKVFSPNLNSSYRTTKFN